MTNPYKNVFGDEDSMTHVNLFKGLAEFWDSAQRNGMLGTILDAPQAREYYGKCLARALISRHYYGLYTPHLRTLHGVES